MANEKYSVMDLAEKIGVPRTTINDWLNRYAEYIDFQFQGKRRIYTENTLEVLRKIGDLRAQDVPFSEIGSHLSQIFPVHPVLQPQSDALFGDEEPEEKQQSADLDENVVPDAQKVQSKEEMHSYALQIKQRSEEIALMIRSHFQEMNQYALQQKQQSEEIGLMIRDTLQKMDEQTSNLKRQSEGFYSQTGKDFQSVNDRLTNMECNTRESGMRVRLTLVLCSVLAVFGIILGVFLFIQADRQKKLAAEQDVSLENLQNGIRTQNETTSSRTKNLEDRIQFLEGKISAQSEQYEKTLNDMRTLYDKREEETRKSLEAGFAAERAQLESKNAEIQHSRDVIDSELNYQIEHLQQELEKLRAEQVAAGKKTVPAQEVESAVIVPESVKKLVSPDAEK